MHFQSTVASNQPAGLSSWSPNGVGSMPPTAVQQQMQPGSSSAGALAGIQSMSPTSQDAFQAGFTPMLGAHAQSKELEVGQDESTHQKAKTTRLDAKINALKVIADTGDEEASAEILQLQADRQVACEAITNLKSPSEQIRILTGALPRKRQGWHQRKSTSQSARLLSPMQRKELRQAGLQWTKSRSNLHRSRRRWLQAVHLSSM